MVKKQCVLSFILLSFFLFGFSSRPKNDTSTSSMNALPKHVVNNGLDAAFEVAKNISDPTSKRKMLTVVAKGYAAAGDTKTAYQIASQSSGSNLGASRLLIITDIAMSLAEQNHGQDAVTFIANLPNISERDYTYEHICLYFFSIKNLEMAKKVMEKITSPITQSRMQRKYVEELVEENALNDALELAKTITSTSEKESALATICQAYAKTKNSEMIDFCLSAIHQPEIRAEALKDITSIFASQGNFKLALKFADGIEDTYVFNQTQAIIVLNYAKNKQFESAYRLSESIEVEHFKSLSISYIAVELTRFNQLDKALEVVDSFDSEPLQQSTYAEMTDVLAKNSRFEEALLVASKITDQSKSNALIINAAGYFGNRKDYLHPTLLINQISDPALKSAATSAFLIQFAPHGSMDKVLSLASTIGDKTMRDTTLSKIAESIISTDKIADALSCLKLIESNPFRVETALTLAQKVANPLHAEFANPFLDIAEPLISKYLNGIEKAQAYTKMAAIYAELNLPILSATALGNATKLLALLPPSKEKDNEIKALFAAHLIADKPSEAIELLTFLNNPEDWVLLYLQIPTASNPVDEKRLKKQILNSLEKLKKK